MAKKAARKKAAVKTYKIKKDEPERRAYDGFIKHPWYKLAIAATIGALAGWIFRTIFRRR